MPTAFQHRPMSKILAPAPEVAPAPGEAKPAPVAPVVVEVPDKYKDKSVEDVIHMHQNAEQALGRANNELGSLRGLVTDLSAVQRQSVASPNVVEEPVTVSGDELLANPVDAIRSVIQPQLDEQSARHDADRVATQVQTESSALMRDFGDLDATVASPEFQEFAARTAGRQADFNTAASGEGLTQVRAARRLLEDFNDFKLAMNPDPNPAPTPVEQARLVANESGKGGAPINTKPQIFESDVIKLINSDPDKYRSPSFQAEMLAAIKEKRFVKNA